MVSGTAANVLEGLLNREWPDSVAGLIAQIRDGVVIMNECIEFLKAQSGTAYRDLYARKLVDIALYLIVGTLFCDQATASDVKLAVAKYWLTWRMPEIRSNRERIFSRDQSAVDDFAILAGPVPVSE